METKFVITNDTIVSVNFNKASVYVDACFLLALKDFNDSKQREKAFELLKKLQSESAKELVISNLVMTEVVHNIFKRRIRNVLFLKHNWDKNGLKPTSDEMKIIGDLPTANGLKEIILNERREHNLDSLLANGDFYFSIDKLVKLLKQKLPAKRNGLSLYYRESVGEYLILVESLKKLGLGFRVGTSNELTHDFVLEFSPDYQLEPYDAEHLVVAEAEGCQYLITFDGDFSNHYYKEGYNSVKIINTAS